MLSYILLDSRGRLFDRLVESMEDYSLSNLLVELLSIRIQTDSEKTLESNQSTRQSDDDDEDDRILQEILIKRQTETLHKMVDKLGPHNRDSEISLNAANGLKDVMEQEGSLSLFFKKDLDLTRHLMELASDPSNSLN